MLVATIIDPLRFAYGRSGRPALLDLLRDRSNHAGANRTATFAFFLGDRFFGTLTAHVHGEEADKYGFTSSLPVAILKVMAPDLMPLLAPREVHGRPSDFPVAGAETEGRPPAMGPALKVPRHPAVDAATLSRMLLGPAVPDTNVIRSPNSWE